MRLNHHSVLAMPSSPGSDHTESNSPIKNQQSESHEQKAENATPSAELVTTIVEDNAAHETVFLDRNGNLSFADPSSPVDKVFIQHSLEGNTLLAVSSTSELPRRPRKRSTKNQNNSMAVTPRVTRSNNITPQTIQKPSNPKKRSAPMKKPPVVKRHAMKFPQTTTLDDQLCSGIPNQGHLVVPIDVDKFPDSKEAIPPSKAQKCPPAAAETVDRAAMMPLDESHGRGDPPLEINISPVDVKPESKKRAVYNIEDNEVIHIVDQERPTKRTRIDPEKPSLPYQRKKYGRIGRTSSPRAEFPIPAVDFDEIPDPKHIGVVERPNSRPSAMNSKHSGKKTEPKPAAPKKRKEEHQDVKLGVKPTAQKVPVSLAKAKRDSQAKESLSKIDHHVHPLSSPPVSLTNK